VLTLLTAYPAFLWLVSAPSVSRLMATDLWFSLLFASYAAPMTVFLTEIMPADVRTAGFSLVFSAGTAIFGGFTPAISTRLIQATGNRAIPGVWLSFAAACGLNSTALLARGRISTQQTCRKEAGSRATVFPLPDRSPPNVGVDLACS